jgi:hypothetical protein
MDIAKSESGKTIIRVQVKEFKGETYLDIRNFYKDSETGEFCPTKKGVAIPITLAEEVLESAKAVYLATD